MNAWLFGSFGALGLLLAAIGIYGVISYSVSRRTREMGIRLALGASPARLQWLVVGQTFAPVLTGMVAGLAASLALSRFVANLLYEVQPRDVPTYGLVCLVLCASALVAAYLPARRASAVDPIQTLHVQ
jgi:ABC-type antimicrobial peptide transport system permease subunit